MSLPQVEFFSDVDTNGLFKIYVDTKTFTEDGGEPQETALSNGSTDEQFRKKVAAKIRSSFISLLKSISNSRCANLPQDLLDKLFDENGTLYAGTDSYTKSVYGLLCSNNVMIQDFYDNTGSNNPIATKISDKDCNIAYFTFKMQFKYKLLDYVIQVDIGHSLYTNDYTGNGLDDVTVTGDLTVCNNLNITGSSSLSSVSSTGSANLHNLIVGGTSQFNNTVTVGDIACSHDVKIYGGENINNDGNINTDKYLEWDASASLLNLKGKLIIGTNNGTHNDNVIIHGQTGKLEWDSATDKLDLDGTLNIQKDATILGDVTIGSPTHDAHLNIYGSEVTKSIEWNNSGNNKLILKGALDIGTATAGHFVKIYSNSANKYIYWDPGNYKLQINANNVVIGDECNCSNLKIWGSDAGKYIDWNTVANKLQIVGDVELDAAHSLTLKGSYNGNTITCIWDGCDGILKNDGKTILSETDISTSLTCGTAGTGCNFIVHGADSTGNKIDWSKATNIFGITGLLTVSGNTTLAGQLITNNDVTMNSATGGKELTWTHATNTLQVNGITNLNGAVTVTAVGGSIVTVDSNITLEKPVQINDSVTIGVDDTGYLFKVFGNTTGKYIEWDNTSNTYTIKGNTVLDGNVTTQTGTLTINSDTTINAANTLTCAGVSNFNNTVNLTGALNTAEATVITCTGADGSWTWNNTANTLDLLCDLTMHDKTMRLESSDFTIDSCTNNYYLKWLKASQELQIYSNNIKITSNFELNDDKDNPTRTINWDTTTKTLTCNAQLHTYDHVSLFCENNNNNNKVEWNKSTGTLVVDSIFNLQNNDNSLSINWDQTNLTCNAPLITNDSITINSTGGNIITWSKANGTLTADAVVKLEKNGTDYYIEWNNATPKFTINSDLDIKKGNVNIYNSGDVPKIIWTSAGNGKLEVKSDVDFSIGDIKLIGDTSNITWTSDSNILTATDCCITLKNDDESNKIIWDPATDLSILSKVNIDGDVNILGNNAKSIEWDKSNANLTLDVNDILITSTTLVINSCLTTKKDIKIQDDGGCDRITWEDTTKLLNIATDTELNGALAACKIVWDWDTNTLTSEAKKVILNGTQVVDAPNAGNFTGQVEWDKATNRLNVDGSLVKKPFSKTDSNGDTILNLSNHNNFHLTLCGDITLKNPATECPGQEGRIVINGANRTITLDTDWYIEREFCTPGADRQITLTGPINVLVYYVFDTNKILLRLEKDYINACPAPGC